jgi:hypothetical protein
MSDLLEALKDTNRLTEAILNMMPCPVQRDTLADARTRAQLLTERIIEASRQAGAVGTRDAGESCISITRADELERAINFAIDKLEHPSFSTSTRLDAIQILKAALNGGAA